ncbi:hypothetical protein BHM03_00061308 [Ensete ventricosum]|nr:hypothetical protein BHM03_00061308 [Ensete ventricosum]
MRLWAIVAVSGEEEMRRVRRGAMVTVVDDSGCNCKDNNERQRQRAWLEAAATTKDGGTTVMGGEMLATGAAGWQQGWRCVGEIGKTAIVGLGEEA